MSSDDFKIKISCDGKIIIERNGDSIHNQKLFEALSEIGNDPLALKRFLMQWEERKVLVGPCDLCG